MKEIWACFEYDGDHDILIGLFSKKELAEEYINLLIQPRVEYHKKYNQELYNYNYFLRDYEIKQLFLAENNLDVGCKEFFQVRLSLNGIEIEKKRTMYKNIYHIEWSQEFPKIHITGSKQHRGIWSYSEHSYDDAYERGLKWLYENKYLNKDEVFSLTREL